MLLVHMDEQFGVSSPRLASPRLAAVHRSSCLLSSSSSTAASHRPPHHANLMLCGFCGAICADGVHLQSRGMLHDHHRCLPCRPKRRHGVGSLLDHHHRHYTATIGILLSLLPLWLGFTPFFTATPLTEHIIPCLNNIFFFMLLHQG